MSIILLSLSMAATLLNNGRVEYLVAIETVACIAEDICYIKPKRQKAWQVLEWSHSTSMYYFLIMSFATCLSA